MCHYISMFLSEIYRGGNLNDNHSKWMTISGAAGLFFFGIANFTDLFTGSSILAGCLQIGVNAFVFVIWNRAFWQSRGLRKFVALFGVVFPFIMASITILRVLIPAIFR